MIALLCFPRCQNAKESTCQCRRHWRHGFYPWVGWIPRRRKWQPTLVFLPGKSHGESCLAGYNLWGCKESWLSNWTHTSVLFLDTCIFVSCNNSFQKPSLPSLYKNAPWHSQSRSYHRRLEAIAASHPMSHVLKAPQEVEWDHWWLPGAEEV